MSVTNYLNLFLDPVSDAITPELAQAVIDIRADAQTQARIEKLREKANNGTLSLSKKKPITKNS